MNKCSKGIVKKQENGLWTFDIRINGKRKRKLGYKSYKAAEEAMNAAKEGKKEPEKQNANEEFWTKEKLTTMRDVILPRMSSIQEAVVFAKNKWKRSLNLSHFKVKFKKQFGHGPGKHLSPKKKPKEKNTFWTTDKLLYMRDTIFPQSKSMLEVSERVLKKWDRKFSSSHFKKVFKDHFGHGPKKYLGLLAGSIESAFSGLPPESNPMFLNQVIVSQKSRLERVEKQLIKATNLSDMIKFELRGSTSVPIDPATWLIQECKKKYHHGIPMLNMADFHYSEVVKAEQIGGVNFYNIREANKRIRRIFEKVLSLIENTYAMSDFPGCIINFLGDMISGLIHEELRRTNYQSFRVL